MNLNDGMKSSPAQKQIPPQQMPEQGQPVNQQQEQGGQQVSPEAQEQFDIFVANGMSVIHSKQVTESILNQLANEQNKLEAFATILVNVVSKLFDSAGKNGVQITKDTLIYGSNVLLQEILSVAETAGMQALSEEQKTEIFQRGVSMYLDQSVKTGRMTKEQVIALSNEAKQTQEGQSVMQTAQQSGGFK